ncbi:rRNA pseudouridine synthase [Luteolibacter flavescens]|uniref:Pseudouridine synthase n=1 Tax=Luteolibacter flavescens TaxID=1859460 RepID=A0ABT3FKK9_9BACT|nr:pseudouridine synthase [Luteolibacter flavescens]MCW1883744.1 rRNA pseudouridine synthase [Luteolibacter flavescens]
MPEGTRLNKFLASCGVGSRRACDAMVQDGRVEINGKPCLNPAHHVEPGDFVRVDGKRVQTKETSTVMFYKPRGYVCSREDELGRDTIYTILPTILKHLHHVGRLDRDSEGLLILTNDGDLSQTLMHPSKLVEKEYIVTSNQPVLNEHLDLFKSGVYVEKVRMRAKEVTRLSSRRYKIVLETGLKRQIRMMFQALGYQVQKLVRVRIGMVELGDLPEGAWLPIDEKVITLLQKNPKPRGGNRPAVKAAKKTAKKAAKKAAPASAPPRAAAKPARRSSASEARPPSARGFGKKTAKRAPRRG